MYFTSQLISGQIYFPKMFFTAFIYGADKHIHYTPYNARCKFKHVATKSDGIDLS